MEKVTPIRSVSRSLAVLQAINRSGPLCMNEIAQASRLPYPTVCRIVHTLVAEGMVRRDEPGKRYRPTSMVQSLSCGYSDHGVIAEVSEDILRELTREVLWPALVSSRVGGSMVVRTSTTHLTSLSFNNFEPGFSMSIATTAAGQVYLAHLPDEQRDNIVAGLKLRDPKLDGDALYERLDELRRQGYAARPFEGFTGAPGRTSALAAPIVENGKVHGVVSLIVFSSAMPIASAVERYVDKLMATGRSIAAEIAAKRVF